MSNRPTTTRRPQAGEQRSVAPLAQSSLVSWSAEEMQVIKDTVARGANLSDAEFKMFGYVCRELGADPLRKQIYAIRYQSGAAPTFQVAIDFYRAKAQGTGMIRGMLGPEWCGEDGEWKDVWLPDTPPMAARFGVVHAEMGEVWATAMFREYNVANTMWKQRPAGQLAKCAEALCYRRAFPDKLGGVYTHDEAGAAVDPETGEIIEGEATEVETFGTPPRSLDAIIDGVRGILQEHGWKWSELRRLPGWDEKSESAKEGLRAWCSQRPEEDLLAVIKARLGGEAEKPQEDEAPEQAEEPAEAVEGAVLSEEEAAMEAEFAAGQAPLMEG